MTLDQVIANLKQHANAQAVGYDQIWQMTHPFCIPGSGKEHIWSRVGILSRLIPRSYKRV
jgi:hypothetical protein